MNAYKITNKTWMSEWKISDENMNEWMNNN